MDLVYDVAQFTADSSLYIQRYIWSLIGIKPTTQPKPQEFYVSNSAHRNFSPEFNMFSTRIAGISGAAAVMVSAYGAHKGFLL